MKKIWLLAFLLFVIILVISSYFFFFPQKQNTPKISPMISSPTPTVISTPLTFKNIIDYPYSEMFTYRDPNNLPPKEKGKYILVVTGDVIPARSTNNKMVTKNDFLYPFRKTADFLKKAGDLRYINLETPLLKDCPPTTEGMIFCGSDKVAEGLIFAGVNVVNLANNHLGNHLKDGIDETVALLKKNNISVAGNHSSAIVTIKEKKFGFLGYNDIGQKEEGISWADIPTIEKEVKELKKKVDFVVVQFHWGVEYVSDPGDRQKELGRATIDAGADLVIGNHPHWVQGVEIYNNKLITYAHGNFVFDQMWSQETREGVVGIYTFNDKYLESVRYYPVIIEDYAQPRFADEKEAKKILQKMINSTEKIKKISLKK